MANEIGKITEKSKTTAKSSPVKAVISWLIETDREFRVAQTMVNETREKR